MDFALHVLENLFTLNTLMILLIGTVVGIIVGVLPGFNAPSGIAVAIPLTFFFTPAQGLLLLGVIYASALYGGSLSAILINVPGEPADIATTFEGYQMAKKGQAHKAIQIAAIASGFGGLIGVFALILFSPPLCRLALSFGPAELFWVAVFGLTIISAISKDLWQALIGGAFGFMMATVGISSVTGTPRFTFGSEYLISGINAVAALIGIFALSEMINLFEKATGREYITERVELEHVSFWCNVKEYFRYPKAISIGSVIGIFIGIVPAAGASISAIVAYGETKRRSKFRESYGTGVIEGLVAPDTAKNADVGGSLIPLFSLGIPGSPAAAVLLGGLMIHGLIPGHTLFTEHAETMYTFLTGMVLTQLAMVLFGIVGARFWSKITLVPLQLLAPVVIALCIIGTYTARNNMADVYVMLVIGILMYIGGKLGFHPASVIMGLMLGDIAENGFLLGRRLGEAAGIPYLYFLSHPASMIFVALTFLSIGLTIYLETEDRRRAKQREKKSPLVNNTFGHNSPGSFGSRLRRPGTLRRYEWNLIVAIMAILLGTSILFYIRNWDFEDKIFPMLTAGAIIVNGIIILAKEILLPTFRELNCVFADYPLRMIIFTVSMTVIYCTLITTLGFYVTTFFYLLVVPLLLVKDKKRYFINRALPYAVLSTVAIYLIFKLSVGVITPRGFLF